MMGERRVMQEALFYGFSLERHVPDDHLLRKIDRFVDLSGLRAHLGPYYSDVGRPSIDPGLMMRMLIVGYCFGIRSERRLCEEVHLNLAYRGLSTPLFSAGQVGSARKGSGFFACSTPGGVGGQDGLRRIGRPSSATRPAGKCRTVATSDAGSSDLAPFRALLSAWSAELGCSLMCPFLSCGRHRHSARVRPPEVSSVGPHPVHDHGEPACEGDLRAFNAASLRDPHGPGSER
jgi:Transposase domain (DUF772)